VNAGVVPIDDSSTDPTKSRIPSEPTDYDKALSRALLLRPDYLAAQSAVAAAQQSLRAARLGHSPVLSASAGTGVASTLTTGTGFLGNNTIGLIVSVPVYDQGVTNTKVAQSSVLLDQAEASSNQGELTVESDVRQAFATLEGAQDALKIAETQLALAQEVLSDTQEQYRGGYTVLPLLLNAQTQLSAAEDQRLTAIYTLRQAEQNYLLALGDL
jgi:outer membrane protein